MPAVVNDALCDGCTGRAKQQCIAICPYDAVRLVSGKAFVDRGTCDDCKACCEACPVRAVVME